MIVISVLICFAYFSFNTIALQINLFIPTTAFTDDLQINPHSNLAHIAQRINTKNSDLNKIAY